MTNLLSRAVQRLQKTLVSAVGASLVAWKRDAAGAVLRALSDELKDRVSVKQFGAKGDGVADDTAAIQAAVDFAYTNNIGDVFVPPGLYLISSVVRNWDAVRSVNIVGSGKRATVFKKFGNSTTPMFDWSANDNILETYSNFESFAIRGNAKTHHGIRIVKCARFTMCDVDIGGCDRAIDNQGALVWYGEGLTIQGNNTGLYTTRAETAAGGFIYPNAITLRDSNICFNTSYGVNAGYGNGMRIRDCDIESNGTAGDQNTGGVILKSLNTEFGVGSASIDGCWFEGNKGWSITVDDANTATSVSVIDTQIVASEAGQAGRVMSARSCRLVSVMALSPGDKVSVVASHSYAENCTISNLDDTSVRKTWLNIVTSTMSVQNGGGFCNGLEASSGKPLRLTWGGGAGVFSITPDTNNGHADYVTASGLHRFDNQIGFFRAIPLANAKTLAFFVDEADGKAKFKNEAGVVTPLY